MDESDLLTKKSSFVIVAVDNEFDVSTEFEKSKELI